MIWIKFDSMVLKQVQLDPFSGCQGHSWSDWGQSKDKTLLRVQTPACKSSILITNHIPGKWKYLFSFFPFYLRSRHWPLKCLQLLRVPFLYHGESQALICTVNVSSWVNCEDIGHLSRFIRQLCAWRYSFQNTLMLPLWKQPLAGECYYLTGLTLLKIERPMPLLNFVLHTSKQFIIVCSQQL